MPTPTRQQIKQWRERLIVQQSSEAMKRIMRVITGLKPEAQRRGVRAALALLD